MTIIDKPDIVSLCGNLKQFKIINDEAVDFELRCGNTILISEKLYPSNSIIDINIDDVIDSCLSVGIPSLSTITKVQEDAQKVFAATISSSNSGTLTHTFTVIKGGIKISNLDITTFLKNNFLTRQPQIKEITVDSLEFLSYYPTSVNLSLKIIANTTIGQKIKTISLEANKTVMINLSYFKIREYFSNNIFDYDVYVHDSINNRLTAIHRYIVRNKKTNDKHYLFENSLGGLDSYIAQGVCEQSINVSCNVFSRYKVKSSTNKENKYIYTQYSLLNRTETEWIKDLLMSKQLYVYNDALESIFIPDNESQLDDSDISEFSFSYEFSNQSKLGEISKREDIPNLISLDRDYLFFLNNRLADLNELEVSSESLFIPGQSIIGSPGKLSVNSLIAYTRSSILSTLLPLFSGIAESNNVNISTVWSKAAVPNLDKLVVDVNGNLIVPGNIIAFGDTNYVQNLIDAMPFASNSSKGIAQFSNQFSIVGGVVSINGDISGSLNLSELANYLVTNKYATETFVTSRGYLTTHQSLANYSVINHTHSQYLTAHQSLAGYAKIGGDINQLFRTNRLDARNTANGQGLSIVGNRIWGSKTNDTDYDDILFGENQDVIIKRIGRVDAVSFKEGDKLLSEKYAKINGDFSQVFKTRVLDLSRETSSQMGINFYSDRFNAWQIYMSPSGGSGSGCKGNVTAPQGSVVSSWALRSFIENSGGYGWIWESGALSTTTPSIIAELSSNTGNFKIKGSFIAGGEITAYSDMRLKNIENKPVSSILDNIEKLNVFNYTWKDKNRDNNIHLGVSAQAVQALFPEITPRGGDGFLSLDYGRLGVVVAIKGLQETKLWMSAKDKKILELENRVKELENQRYVA